MQIDKEKLWGLCSKWFGELYFLKCPACWASGTFFLAAYILGDLCVSSLSGPFLPIGPLHVCHSGPCFHLGHCFPRLPSEDLGSQEAQALWVGCRALTVRVQVAPWNSKQGQETEPGLLEPGSEEELMVLSLSQRPLCRG